jgi:hypothetical protein
LDRLFDAADSDDEHRATVREHHPDGLAGLEITCRL